MLLAKVLDKLFNRRNTFEVESLEGEVLINGTPLSEFATKGDVSNNQTTTVVVRDAVTNLNGYPGATNHYSAEYSSEGYVHYDILYDGEPCDEDKAKRYMKFMSGSDFLPGYEYEVPKQTLFIFPDKSVWKVQYSSTGGLQLFKMSGASVELPTIVSGDAGKVPVVNESETGFVYGSAGEKYYAHRLTVPFTVGVNGAFSVRFTLINTISTKLDTYSKVVSELERQGYWASYHLAVEYCTQLISNGVDVSDKAVNVQIYPSGNQVYCTATIIDLTNGTITGVSIPASSSSTITDAVKEL